MFDCEQYNYLIERRTSLMNPDLIESPDKLQYVLKQLYDADPILLD